MKWSLHTAYSIICMNLFCCSSAALLLSRYYDALHTRWFTGQCYMPKAGFTPKQLATSNAWSCITGEQYLDGRIPLKRILENGVVRMQTELKLMMFFWVLVLCRLISRCQCFGEMYCLHLQGCIFSPEDGDIMFLRNVGVYWQVYMAPKPRRSSSSSSSPLPWKHHLNWNCLVTKSGGDVSNEYWN
jgi:hypothetical protein